MLNEESRVRMNYISIEVTSGGFSTCPEKAKVLGKVKSSQLVTY